MYKALSSKVVSGPYASVTPITNLVYDAATFSVPLTPIVMQNAKGTVAEAYTCTGSCTTKLTDIFLSAKPPATSAATAGGVEQDMWESTPHSGGYFYSQDIYYPNGAVGSMQAALVTSSGSASIGLPNLTYGVDGEGRPNSATEPAHNLVTAALYNPAGQPTSLTFGNAATGSASDTDSFSYDANTGRLTSIVNSINPTPSSGDYSVTSGLTWNPNGSLQQFVFTDGNASSNSQTCSYKADDLTRLTSASCKNGSTTEWSQTFTFNPFGNITKSGSGAYSASYTTATNQVSSGISPAPTYDANGNQTNLTSGMSSKALSWNASSQPITINGIRPPMTPWAAWSRPAPAQPISSSSSGPRAICLPSTVADWSRARSRFPAGTRRFIIRVD